MSRSRSSGKLPPLAIKRMMFANIHREFLADLLKNDGDFLIRRGSEGGLVISVNQQGRIRHIKVGENQQRICIDGRKFPSFDDMVRYYYSTGDRIGNSGARLTTPIWNTCEMIDAKRVEFVDQLGRGNFGEVWKAKLKPYDEMVAIKIVAGNASRKEREECIAEARLMSIMNHENIVKLKGIGLWEQPHGPPRLLIILELCDHGSLDKLLEKGLLSDEDEVKALLDTAKGLEYLHKREIIHRDVASRNCLVTLHPDKKSFTVKVADFGLSRLARTIPTGDETPAPRFLNAAGYVEGASVDVRVGRVEFRHSDARGIQQREEPVRAVLLNGEYQVGRSRSDAQSWFSLAHSGQHAERNGSNGQSLSAERIRTTVDVRSGGRAEDLLRQHRPAVNERPRPARHGLTRHFSDVRGLDGDLVAILGDFEKVGVAKSAKKS